MSDMLFRNGDLYNVRNHFNGIGQWANKALGIPAEMTNSVRDAIRATLINSTITLVIHFEGELLNKGVRLTFTRVAGQT